MGFDFENLLYLLGLIIWIASSMRRSKKSKKTFQKGDRDLKKTSQKNIPKSFSDLVKQVKELNKKEEKILKKEVEINTYKSEEINDYNDELLINDGKELKNEPAIDQKESINKELSLETTNNKETLSENDLNKHKKIDRLAGYEIKENVESSYRLNLIEDLNDRDFLKKGFLLKEILKRKF